MMKRSDAAATMPGRRGHDAPGHSRSATSARFYNERAEPVDGAAEDVARIAAAETELARRRIVALQAVVPAGHADARALRPLMRGDMARIGAEQLLLVGMLAWRWRRKLPAALVPGLPPADPIVQAMGAADAD